MSGFNFLLALGIGAFFGSMGGKLLALWTLERKRKRALRLREARFWQQRAEWKAEVERSTGRSNRGGSK